MENYLKVLWREILTRGEYIGPLLVILGFLLLLVQSALIIAGLQTETTLFFVSLALLSCGLGFTAIGIAVKSDKRHTDMLERIDKNVLNLMEGDTVESPKVQTITLKPVEAKTGVGKARVEVGEPKDITIKVPLATVVTEGLPPHVEIKGQTKEEVQKRLDEDTKRVGFVRGEIYKLDDGGWGIHWGGKHPL